MPWGLVNGWVQPGQRPAWSYMGGLGIPSPRPGLGVPGAGARSRLGVPGAGARSRLGVPGAGARPALGDARPRFDDVPIIQVAAPVPRSNTRDMTSRALAGDLAGFGVNVPPPKTHAGRLANKVAARLMWARRPIAIRWTSPTGQEPFEWRIYAPPRARDGVLQVARDVVREIGQGDVTIRIEQDPRPGLAPDRTWWVAFLPAALAPPPVQDEPSGQALGNAARTALTPLRYPDFGPTAWRTSGEPLVPGYGDTSLHDQAPAIAPTAAELAVVRRLISVFRSRGEAAALEDARRVGPRFFRGAHAWTRYRAAPEPVLAQAVAELRASMAAHASKHALATPDAAGARIELAFLDERLAEVRQSATKNHTPPQAVIDRPDVPKVGVPRWVSFSLLALALLSATAAVGSAAARGS